MTRRRRTPSPARRDHTAAPGRRSRGLVGAGLTAVGLALLVTTGSAAPVNRAAVEVTATWTALPLADWCQRMGDVAGCPVILDRRIDPTTPVTIACDHEPLTAVLARVAATVDAEPQVLTSTIRLVPRSQGDLVLRAEAARRATIAELPAGPRQVLEARDESHWVAGSTPKYLLEATTEYGNARLTGIDAIPHDHFPALVLPPLSLAERIDLLLAHFDRRAEWKAGAGGRPTGRIVPLDQGVTAATAVATVPRQTPRPKAGTRDVFTLRLEAPLDEALRAVAARLGLAVAIDEDALRARGVSSREIVRATVRDASRDELLDAIVAPLGLRWRIEDDTLVVTTPE